MTEGNKKPVVLVDGSSYLYRAYHALPPLSTASGRPTGAVRGVISMIRRLQKDYPHGTIAVVFDARGKTFRDELFAQYKANRPSMPDDLAAQVEPIHDIIRAMGLPLIIKEGVEADDVIGTLARQAEAMCRPVVISTGDKDMAQLVTDDITLVNTMTNTVLDPDGVRAKYGVPPELVVDLLALMGDKSDNIPGVAGIGEKTARVLLADIGDLDAIYANLDRITGLDIRGAKKLPEKLRSEQDKARLSYRLATISTDVALDFGPDDLALGVPGEARLAELFRELEFSGWLKELLGQTSPVDSGPKANYETVLTEAALATWLDRLAKADIFAFDTETTSLNYIDAEVVGVSFAVDEGEAAYVPVAHSYPGAPEQLDRDLVLERLRPLLEAADRPKIGQNLKYDMSVLANHGIELRGVRYDTMLESYVVNSTATRHDMDSLALRYLSYKTIPFKQVAGSGAKQLTFDQVGIEEAAPYAAEDADVTVRLHRRLWPNIESEPGLKRVFEQIEVPLVPVLSRMERSGALIDRRQLATQSAELGRRIIELGAKAHELAGGKFNLSSPKQLAEILFNRLELPVLRKTPKGAPSTAEEVLQELALDYPLPEVILEYRSLSKLKSTYTDRLPEMISGRTGRVHTSYHQAVAATGRLSSSDPNLQNIPVRTGEGRRIRQAFIAPPGYRLLAADYSQIELRIMAHLSGDEGLLRAFAEGRDIHRATAAEVFGVEPEQVTADQRRSAKAINFGLIYGMSAFGLGRQLRVGRKQAQEYIDRYFSRYPGVLRHMDDTRRLAADKGYVETLFGRRLYLPEIDSRNGMRRQAAERTAINAPMQGTAADIIKRAMIEIDHWMTGSKPAAKMIMQVHDELVFEVADDAVDGIAERVRGIMASAAELSVPLEVDVGIGANWDEAH